MQQLVVRDTSIPVLGPEDLVAHKVVFNRPQDWVDIENVLDQQPGFDLGVVRRWIVELYGLPEARSRLARLNALAGAHGVAPVELPRRPSLGERVRGRLRRRSPS